VVTDKRVGVLMGGTSAEREVSLKSGTAVHNVLKTAGYNTVAIDVGSDICSALATARVEIAFLALHGGYGEDGSIQGMLEVLGIPYTGSGVLSSALAMDKEASKKVFLYHNVPVPPFEVFRKGQAIKETVVGFPCVVKPAAEGSSIGVAIVQEKNDFEKAIDNAFSFGSRLIVEPYIEGKEVHIGILNGTVLGGVEVRPAGGFYSYEAKYTAGLTEYILPPQLDKAVYEKAKAAALSAHTALGCKGAARVDLRIDVHGSPYVLEVNTIPGMTETSLLPKIAKLAGFDFLPLLEEIIKGALDESE
jgi:D-alanine-D-alanine ligase